MKSIIILSIALVSIIGVAHSQDTTRTPVPQGDPELKQSPDQLNQSMLQDMVKITSAQLPDDVKAAMMGDEFKGSKTYYKHKKRKEYGVEVRDGEVSSFHFFDKDGQPLNKRD
ncbi:MAG: hypothetical protein WKF87_06375 [Chryseolinea sp.]